MLLKPKNHINETYLDFNIKQPVKKASKSDSKKLSPVPPPYWTLPEHIYKWIIQMFPSVIDKNNKTAHLELAIIDRLIYGRTWVQVSQGFVFSICKVKRASLPLIEQAIKNLGGLVQLKKIKTYITLEERDYIVGDSSRVLVYCPTQEFEVLKLNYRQSRVDDVQVYVMTGNIVTAQSKKTMKKQLLKYQEEVNLFYQKQENNMLPNMVDYCNLVNELSNNQTRLRLITKNIKEADDQLEKWFEAGKEPCDSLDKYLHHKRSLIRVNNNVLNVYRIVKSYSPRIFDMVDQNLHGDIRKILYNGCKDVDLSRSQLAILSSLSGCDKLKEWLEYDNLWGIIGLETNFPKATLKKATYAICFGGNYKTWIKDPDISMSEYEAKLLNNYPFFKALTKAAGTLRSQINKAKFVDIGGTKLTLTKDFKNRNALARKVQWLESMIVYSVLQEVKQNNRMTLIGAYHDGLLINFKDKKESMIESYVSKLNGIAQAKAAEFGITNMSLELKY